ncbi:MAG: hypothetical protein GEV06_12770 [Luteitalea sp.]|nr:hypothetical protein [Luteitalea sp.]
MSEGWRPRSVRLRLALWYGAAVALAVLFYAAGVYMFVRNSLHEELDRTLHDDFELAEEWLDNETPETAASPAGSGHHADGSQLMRWLEVWDPGGDLRFRSSGMEPIPAPAAVPDASEYASAATAVGRPIRTLTSTYTVDGSRLLVRVTRSEERLHHELNELLIGLALGLPIAVIGAAIGGQRAGSRHLTVGTNRSALRSLSPRALWR